MPLRWRDRLRSDPLRLPWGIRYVINLEEVATARGTTPVSGGLRLTWYRDRSNAVLPPPVRAGDQIEVLARAFPVRNFGDPGSFDFRWYMALQGIHLQGTLRSDELMTVNGRPRPSCLEYLARARGDLLRSLDELFAHRPEQAALTRAMLLRDRSFVERDRVVEYKETGVYHVLVLAGLHVAALTAFLFWLRRALRLNLVWTTLFTLVVLAGYLGIVEDRPPILRAALMAGIYLCARLFYRRVDLLNIAAPSTLVILIAQPLKIQTRAFFFPTPQLA